MASRQAGFKAGTASKPAAGRPKPTATSGKPGAPTATSGKPGAAAAVSSKQGAAGAKRSAKERPAASEPSPSPAELFWAEQDKEVCWSVPMAHGASMPWLKPHERGMLLAIERARAMGKTVLLVDPSPDKLIDTYYAYQSSQVVEAKRLVLEEVTGKRSHADTMEGLRQQLVSAMRYGQTLYVRLADSACDFLHAYSDDGQFPLALFNHATIRSLRAHAGPSGANLYGSDHPLAGVLRPTDVLDGVFQLRENVSDQRWRTNVEAEAEAGVEAEAEAEAEAEGVEKADDGFELVLCTQFSVADYQELLRDSLPLEWMQAIAPQPSSVRVHYSHYKAEFALEVGGSLRWAELDEKYAISFVFQGAFGVALQPLDAAAKPQPATSPLALDKSGAWRGLQGGALYGLVVTEDARAEEAARAADPRRSSYVPAPLPTSHSSRAKPPPGRSDDGSTRASELLSEELAALDLDDDVRGRSARYAALREARDVQDVVFGAG